jgi:hypothetical protein
MSQKLLGLLLAIPAAVAMAQQPPMIVGTWNVTSTPTGDTNMPVAKIGGASAYVWIISTTPAGEVHVSVQGDTNFQHLSGGWTRDGQTLILQGQGPNKGFSKQVSWFRLAFDNHGALRGIRRYLDNTASFADYEVVAKKAK